jgi:O-antigen/teichoic acid export membrane protein
VALFLTAQFLPLIMGSAYADSTIALRWLCPLPLIQSVHAFLSDSLTGANLQVQRSWCQIGVAVFNVLINLWLIRGWAWRGASWSSIASEMVLAVILYLLIRAHLRREKREPGTGDRMLNRVVSEVGE